MKKKSSSSVLFAILVLLAACTKEGPQGPEGPAGQNGTSGVNGTNGTNGANGNANVTNFGSYSIATTQWVPSGNSNEYYRTITGITIPNQSTSVVLAFARYPFNNSSIWFGLSARNISYVGDEMHFSFNNNSVNFFYVFSQRPAHTIDVRIVVIPANYRMANIDLKNYEEVKAAFNLKD